MHDLTGKKFGKLVVIEKTNKRLRKMIVWKCRCACGNIRYVPSYYLTSGITTSCRSCIKKRKPEIGDVSVGKIRLYHIWIGMRDRCKNKNNPRYKNYGGRGIDICDEWDKSYREFAKWAWNNGYDNTLSIDRVDNNKGYYPDNCRWATYIEQNNNRRSNRIIEMDGIKMSVTQWERFLKMKPGTIRARMHRGMKAERAFINADLRTIEWKNEEV